MANIANVLADSGFSAADGITSDTTLSITGTAQRNTTYNVLVDGVLNSSFSIGGGGLNQAYTHALVGGLSEGGHVITLVNVTAGSVVEDTRAVTIDLTAPNAPSILEVSDNVTPVTGVVAAGGTTNDATPTVKVGLAGTNAAAGDRVQLFNGASTLGSPVTLTVTHIAQGFVEITPSALTNGQTYAFNAKVIDLAGNTGAASANWSVTIDTAAPPAPAISLVNDNVSPVLGAVANNGVTNDTTPTVRISLVGSGAADGFTVQLQNGAVALGAAATVTAADVANGFIDITAPALTNGVTYSLNARISDLAGNLSAASGNFVVTIDTAPPAAPVISSVVDDINPLTGAIASGATTNDTQLRLSGSAEANAVIKIFDGATLVGQGAANNGGNWNNITLSTPLGEGAHTLTVVAVDAAGNESAGATFNVTIDTVAPGAPSAALAADTGANTGDGVTQNGLVNVTLSGDGVTWSYSLNGGSSWADGAGSSFTVPQGTYPAGQVQVRQADSAGNISSAFSLDGLTIDATPPAAPVVTGFSDDTGVVGDGVTADTTLMLSGTAEANASISVYDGATLLGVATADVLGAWSFATGVLSYAPHSFTATATDLAGNTSASSAALAVTVSIPPPPAPTITGFADDSGAAGDGITNDTTLTLSGAAEANATVKVYDGASLLGETTADGLGAWSFATAALGEGPHSFTATAANAGGTGPASATLPVTVDLTPPEAGTLVLDDYLDTGVSGSDDVTKDKSFALAVSGQEAGASVAFEMKQGAGPWSAADAANLVDGTYQFRAVVTDAAGNLSHTAERTVTVDNTAPAAGTLVLDDYVDTGANGSDDVTQVKSFNLAVSGQEVGATVAFEMRLGAGPWGAADTSNLADGTYEFRGVVTDLAGNVSYTAERTVTVDNTAPAAGTLVLDDYVDTGANGSDDVTQDKSFNLAVSGQEAGASVAFEMKQGAGPWGVANTSNLADGTYEFRAVVTDLAGNVSYTAERTVTVDNTAPASGTLVLNDYVDTGASGADDVTQDKSFTLAVIDQEAGATVAFQMKQGAGPWSAANTSDLADGAYQFRAVVTDLAGNVSYTAERTVTVDNTAPAAGTLTLSNYVDSNVVGDDVTSDKSFDLGITGQESGAAVVFQMKQGAGSWTAADTANLADGTYQFRSEVTDLAGNVAQTPERTITVDTVAPAAPTAQLAEDTGVSGSDGITKNGQINVTLAADATAWRYTVDGGLNWANGVGTSFALANNETYAAGKIRVEQSDLAGNVSAAFSMGAIRVDNILAASPDAISVNEDAISENLYATLLTNDGETGLVIKEVNAIVGAMPTGTGSNTLNFPNGSQLVTFEASDSDLDVLEPGQTQTAKFTYKVEDLAGNTSVQTVTVTVQGMVEPIGSGIFNGTNNNDTLQGSSAVDKLHALNGNDVVIGGGGADILLGGAGNDIFHFDWISEFGDQLFDFQNGTATSAADKVRFNVGVGQIEIGDNDTVVEAGEIIFYVDRLYSPAEIAGLAQNDAQGHLMVARMSGANAATIWYDAPGAGAPVMVLEFVNMKSAKDFADMSFQDFLFV